MITNTKAGGERGVFKKSLRKPLQGIPFKYCTRNSPGLYLYSSLMEEENKMLVEWTSLERDFCWVLQGSFFSVHPPLLKIAENHSSSFLFSRIRTRRLGCFGSLWAAWIRFKMSYFVVSVSCSWVLLFFFFYGIEYILNVEECLGSSTIWSGNFCFQCLSISIVSANSIADRLWQNRFVVISAWNCQDLLKMVGVTFSPASLQ